MPTESVKTVKPDGSGNYPSLSLWESGEQGTLTDTAAVAECYSGQITNNVFISGWTLDSTSYVEIRPASGHEHGGDRTAGFRVTDTTAGGLIRPGVTAVRIRGIVLLPTSNATGIGGQGGVTDLRISGCVIYGGGTSTGIGINPGSQANLVVRAWNNLIYGFEGASVGRGIQEGSGSGSIVHAYNNTVLDCRRGINRVGATGTLRAKNNICQSCTVDYEGTLTDSATNISSDNSSPQTGLRSITLDFANAANDDYHLAASDTEAIGAGTDLHADGNLAFAVDIDGDARPDGAWDIGADQTAGAVYAQTKYRFYQNDGSFL